MLSNLSIFDSFGADIGSETELMFEMMGYEVVLEVGFVFHDLSGLFPSGMTLKLRVSMGYAMWILPPFEHILI